MHREIRALVRSSIFLLFISIGSAAVPGAPQTSQSFSLSFVSVMMLYLEQPLGPRKSFKTIAYAQNRACKRCTPLPVQKVAIFKTDLAG